MDIKQLLPKEHVVLHLSGPDRREVLHALTAPLVAAGIVLDRAAFVADVEQREGHVTTQVPGGIAFPHARSATVRRLGLAMGLAAAPGLTFDPGSPEPCRVLFLIAVPAIAPTAHLPLLRHLSQIVRQSQRVDRLLGLRTSAAVVRAMCAFRG